ncbi:unnamed protein product, partial [Didymodactylos carnosus]
VILQSQDMNIDDSISATTASTIIPSTALTVGIDLRTMTADPSSHTRFIRELVRRSGLATNPDALFDNKAQVLEIKSMELEFPIMHDAELIQAEAGARQPMKKTKLRQEQRILNILNDTSTTNLEKVSAIAQNITLKS